MLPFYKLYIKEYKMDKDMSKVVKGFLIGVVVFFIVATLLVIGVSYLPSFMMKLDAPEAEYFRRNVLHNFGLKLIIATFGSFVITAVGALLVFKFSGNKDNNTGG